MRGGAGMEGGSLGRFGLVYGRRGRGGELNLLRG